jgi:hypothetical protein
VWLLFLKSLVVPLLQGIIQKQKQDELQYNIINQLLLFRWISKLGVKESVCFGILMQTKGLVALVVFNLGLEYKVISPKLFSINVLMVLVIFLNFFKSKIHKRELIFILLGKYYFYYSFSRMDLSSEPNERGSIGSKRTR